LEIRERIESIRTEKGALPAEFGPHSVHPHLIKDEAAGQERYEVKKDTNGIR
jgi:hypothetical protein